MFNSANREKTLERVRISRGSREKAKKKGMASENTRLVYPCREIIVYYEDDATAKAMALDRIYLISIIGARALLLPLGIVVVVVF